MAVRFSADGQDFTTSFSAINRPVTALCWASLAVDRNAFSTFFCLDDNTTSKTLLSQTYSDGIHAQAFSDPGAVYADATGHPGGMAVGGWYKVAVTVDANGNAAFHTATATTTLSSVALSGLVTAAGFTRLRIGESVYGGEWFNGSIANVKVFTAALSVAEMDREFAQYIPHRFANLHSWHPLLTTADIAERSGSGRTLSGGTGAATTAGPPIPWLDLPPIIPVKAPTSTISPVGTRFANTGVTGTTTLPVTPVNTNALLVLYTAIDSPGISIQSVTGGGVATWKRAVEPAVIVSPNRTLDMWYGAVTNPGADTITITPSASVASTRVDLVAQEFKSSRGQEAYWTVDAANNGSGSNGTGTTITFPTLSPLDVGRLYTGYAHTSGTADLASAPAGYTAQSDGSGNPVIYNTAASTDQSPTLTYQAAGTAPSGTVAALFVDNATPYNPPDDIPENVPVTPDSVAQPLVAIRIQTTNL